MRHSFEILRNALKIYDERESYCYLYGAKGQVITEAVFTNLVNAEHDYFSKYTKTQLDKIRKFCIGKIGYDCSGFVSACTGLNSWSGGLWDYTINKTTPENGKAGSLLYRAGHVGLDLGYGYVIHFPTELKTCEITKIQKCGFTGSGELLGFDYSLANNY